MKFCRHTRVLCVLAVLSGSQEALSQRIPRNTPFCIREGCLSGNAQFGAAAAPASRMGDPNTTRFRFAFADSTMGSTAFSFEHTATDPIAAPAPNPFGVSVGNLPMDSAMQLAVELHPGLRAPLIASTVHDGPSSGLALNLPARNPFQFPGIWSDPATACSAQSCLVAVSNTSNSVLFVGVLPDGTVVTTRSGMGAVAPAGRPAVVALSDSEFVVATRSYFLNTLTTSGIQLFGVRNNFNAMQPANSTVTVGIPRPLGVINGNDQSSLAMIRVDRKIVLAYANGQLGGAVSVAVLSVADLLGVQPPGWVEVASGLGTVSHVGLAQSAQSIVLTFQSDQQLFRVPLTISGDGSLAYRAFNAGTDALTQTRLNPVLGHRVTDGPLALVTYDEGPIAGQPGRKARGIYVTTCRTQSDCALTLGHQATCASCTFDGDCVDWGTCPASARDSGVLIDVPDPIDIPNAADVPNGVDVPNPIDIPNSPDVQLDDSGDVILSLDDASDGSSGFDVVVPTDSQRSPPVTGLSFGGGSCGCRIELSTSPSSRQWPIVPAVLFLMSQRKRRKNREN